ILSIMGKPENAIEMIDDRPGHDRRYALNSYKIRNNLSWSSKYSLDEGLKETVKWYKDNKDWWKK
ncbi:MAG TPA: dTDP-glucose 4,6-dehydratase, partial [Clostridia bacterium]|nr:dTDP-glucose 4,6-dehydratase [Clostridia bacterium]